jgi:glycosyltransferase involved in cell wall biosynthesis
MRLTIISPFPRSGRPSRAGGMAQSAQSLYDGLRRDGVLDLRKTPQDYRCPWLFLLSLVRNVVWADVIYVQISGAFTALTNVVVSSSLGGRLGKLVIVRYGGGMPEEFLAVYGTYFHRFLRNAHIVVNSSLAANSFRRRGYQTSIIPNVVDVESFLTAVHQPGTERVLVCRHLDPRYNIPMALHAFKTIKQEFPAATLTVTGDGPMREELIRLSKSLSLQDVVFHPMVPHSRLREIYAKADVFLNPTNSVEIPISLVEAAAAGLVVVSSDNGAIREFIRNEENGLLSTPNDPKMMAKLVITVFRNRRLMDILQKAARRRAERYSWNALREKYYDMFGASKNERFAKGTLEMEIEQV